MPLQAARERQERNAQSYQRDDLVQQKPLIGAAADAKAQEQTGNPNARAAKDRFGKAVGDGKGGVVTSGEVSGDKRDDTPSYSDLSKAPPGKSGPDGGKKDCVIATHAVANGGFSTDVKREAVRWCVKNLHHKWYGEAIRSRLSLPW